MRLESWERQISYYQCAWRFSFRVKDEPARHIKEFQHNCCIHKKITKNTQMNHKREKTSWNMFTT